VIGTGNISHANKIAAAAGCIFNPACDHVICRVENGKLLGGVIFQNFTGASIGIHVAGFDPHWINRDMLWITFNYPFEQLGVKKLVGQIHSGNHKAIAFDRKLGFKEEARIADIFSDGDLIVMSMRREDCRWLRMREKSGK
jgi:RimJ/RimL family protein N-acetyltransferase